MTGSGYQRAYPKPEEEKRALYRLLRAIDADVLLFQEMGSDAYLAELQLDLKTLGMDYPIRHCLLAEDSERRLAVLSRRQVVAWLDHPKIPFKVGERTVLSKRGLLGVRLVWGDAAITFWTLHLKSRLSEDPQDPEASAWRNAEATALRDQLLLEHKAPGDDCYFVLGDFNDYPKSRPLRAFSARGKKLLSIPLTPEDSRGERWTHHEVNTDRYQRIDHLLMSPAVQRRCSGPDASWALNTHIADLEGCQKASDHRALVLELKPGSVPELLSED